jgi:extradiol dioxygenase family protein
VIVDTDLWGKLYSKLFQMNLEVTTEATFLKNKIGEHLSFFIKDPNGYMLEFKSFKNEHEVFRIE